MGGLKEIMPTNALRLVITMLFCTSLVAAHGVPAWERWLRWISGTSDATPVPTLMMGVHMQMSKTPAEQPGDAKRARALVDAAKKVLSRY